ncbi:MAG: TonB-dependent receptor [Gemmatimonadaceae bacterium]
MKFSSWFTITRRVGIGVAVTVAASAPMLGAQDTTATRKPSLDTLERVVIRATRGGGATPTSQTTITRAAIERTYVGQDAPLALLGATGITAASDAGAFSGYSSIRLRGVDQTRLAISVDGVPLNDPEDQVLYFSNVPDFMNSMQSVQVQRGVGSSAFGTAAFAGSLNFESIPVAATPRFGEVQLTSGSWGTRRASVEGATGLINESGFAAYARLSGQETDGYRHNSGNDARSGFVSAGWFGERDAIKFTGFAGRSKMQLAYYAPSEAQLAVDPRVNPMSPDERDDFHQEMASLQYTRVLSPGATLTTTGYRNGAGGNYDVYVGPDLWNFNLDHSWYGLLSTLAWTRGDFALAAGAHLSTYSRGHWLHVRPDLDARVYDNRGFKQEQSAFMKATLTRGAVDWHGDLQLRRAAFRYRPTAGTGIGEPEMDWLFVNPKLGVTWRTSSAVTLHASLGSSGREPTRSDMFAGADDMDAAAAAELLPLDQVKPERLTDLELGARYARGTFALGLNAFSMRFTDEIAPIGAISVTGSQLRRNVDHSARSGLELESAWQAHERLDLSGNVMWMHARIDRYTDAASGITYRDVEPLLTPAVIANAQLAWRPVFFGRTEFTLAARHVGRSFLANDGNTALTTPAFTLADAGAAFTFGSQVLRVQVQNLFDAEAMASGYTDGTERYFFPVAARTLMATVALRF